MQSAKESGSKRCPRTVGYLPKSLLHQGHHRLVLWYQYGPKENQGRLVPENQSAVVLMQQASGTLLLRESTSSRLLTRAGMLPVVLPRAFGLWNVALSRPCTMVVLQRGSCKVFSTAGARNVPTHACPLHPALYATHFACLLARTTTDTQSPPTSSCSADPAGHLAGAIEGINVIVTGEVVSRSEQELVDCDTKMSPPPFHTHTNKHCIRSTLSSVLRSNLSLLPPCSFPAVRVLLGVQHNRRNRRYQRDRDRRGCEPLRAGACGLRHQDGPRLLWRPDGLCL
jgi:hypothetical protein